MEVKFVKLYLSGQEHLAEEIFTYLHELPVKGATLSRGIKSFGRSGDIHSMHLLDAHTNLPLILEFFDEVKKVNTAIKEIQTKAPNAQMVSWLVEHIC